jgi:hypothetical protein
MNKYWEHPVWSLFRTNKGTRIKNTLFEVCLIRIKELVDDNQLNIFSYCPPILPHKPMQIVSKPCVQTVLCGSHVTIHYPVTWPCFTALQTILVIMWKPRHNTLSCDLTLFHGPSEYSCNNVEATSQYIILWLDPVSRPLRVIL